MDEYIRRGEALSEACKGCSIDFPCEPCEPKDCEIKARLQAIPAADVTPVRHGWWIPAQDYSDGNEDIECSSCGEWFKSLELCGRLGEPNYCPVCGSKNKYGGQYE